MGKLTFQKIAIYASLVTLLIGQSPVHAAQMNPDQLRATFEDNSILYSNMAESIECLQNAAEKANEAAASNLVGEDNLKKAFNYFIAKGAPKFVAAAIVGNLYQESKGNPILRQNKGSEPNPMNSGGRYHPWNPSKPAGIGDAWGIAQWDPGVAVYYWQQQAGVQGDVTSLEVQLAIIWWQLQNLAPTSRKNVLGEMTASGNVNEAASIMVKRFFGAGIPRAEVRIAYAMKAMSWQPDPSAAAAAASGTATTCADGGGGGTISDQGGLNEEQAKKFMMNYGDNANGETKKAIPMLWFSCGGPGGSNCVSFSAFWLNKFTNTPKTELLGNGHAVVSGLARRGLPTGKTPKVGAVFSWSGGAYGHTGVVLGMQGDNVIVGHASCTRGRMGIRGRGDGTANGMGSGFIRVGKANDPKVWLGRLPDNFAYPQVDMAAVAKYIGANVDGGGGNVAL